MIATPERRAKKRRGAAPETEETFEQYESRLERERAAILARRASEKEVADRSAARMAKLIGPPRVPQTPEEVQSERAGIERRRKEEESKHALQRFKPSKAESAPGGRVLKIEHGCQASADAFEECLHKFGDLCSFILEEEKYAPADHSTHSWLLRLPESVVQNAEAFEFARVYPVPLDEGGRVIEDDYHPGYVQRFKANWYLPENPLSMEQWLTIKLAFDGLHDDTVTASAVVAEDPALKSRWLWGDRIKWASTTMLSGRDKDGKSTLLRALLSADAEFLGQPVQPRKAMIVTEETQSDWAGHLPHDRIHYFTGPAIEKPEAWDKFIRERGRLMELHGCNILSLDSLSTIYSFDENDSVAVARAFAPLRQLAKTGVAVLVNHHTNKDGGIRGGVAMGAQPDRLLLLSRVDGAAELDCRRVLTSKGRGTRLSHQIEFELLDSGRLALTSDNRSPFARRGR